MAKPKAKTGTVAARRARALEDAAANDAERARIIDETRKAQAATAKRLKDKPTDTRTIAA